MTFRDVLRQETNRDHEALDRSLGNLFSTPSVYISFLRGSLAALEHLEPALVEMGVLSNAPRVDRLRADLSALGAPHQPTPAGWRPQNLSEGFGSAYVVEGSALGGAFLARSAPPAFVGATSYLRGSGDSFAQWREFLGRLEVWAKHAQPSDHAAAVSAARRTFAEYRRALACHGAVADTDSARQTSPP